MKANKYTVSILVEVLSLESVPGLLVEVERIMRNENKAGSLSKDDGDFVRWHTVYEPVEF